MFVRAFSLLRKSLQIHKQSCTLDTVIFLVAYHKNLLTFLRLVLYFYININKQAHASCVPCSIFISIFLLFTFIIVTDKHSYLTGV